MRVVITGVDADGRSCVVGEERIELGSDATAPGFWFGEVYETASVPPPARPNGRGDRLEVGLAPGLVRWQVIDFQPGVTYPMHHTDTVDFDLVLRGSVELHLDDGVHTLHAGDGAVVNGVDHAWAAGPDGARLSVLFVGTPPPADVGGSKV
jgi:quercetin dioxygenase-like cupin family protein